MASTSFSNFPADDEVLIIDDDDSMDEDSNEDTASNDTVTASSKVDVDQGPLPMECSNPWHAHWGNNDNYFKAYQWPSQIPMEIMTIFRLLGFRRQKPSSKRKRKFCMTCINRAAILTEEEKMALVKVGVDRGRPLPMECSNPWHAHWGNNDNYFKAYQWPSQIPMEIMTIFRLLGFRRQKPSSKRKRKFCMTCINRAALLTEEEKMALAKKSENPSTGASLKMEELKSTGVNTRKQSEEAQIQAQLEKLDTLELDDDEREMQAKQLRMLTFVNPGKFMEDFDPERSTREMKKMTRRIYKEKGNKKKQLYDENGLLISTGCDLCDCLEVECPGCHFPCAKCGSEKCGADCRVNRRWRFEYIEVEGTGLTINWPWD